MIYDNICEFLINNLGEDNYIIKYNNNLDYDWANLIADESQSYTDTTIFGVLRVEGGENSFAGDLTIRNESVSVTFAIPTNRDILNEQIANINTLVELNGSEIVGDDDTQSCIVYFNNRTDGDIKSVDINGNEVDYMITTLYLQCTISTNLINSNDISVTIDGTAISGKIEVDYSCAKTLESATYKNTTFKADLSATSITDTLIVKCVMTQNNTLLSTLMTDQESLTNYTIAYYNGIVTRSLTMQLQKIDEAVITGGAATCILTFVNGCKNYT